ncbi:hypothetical protein BY996DRAFT_4583129 [Phakopsora pachyrhizi]|uniref:FAD/NAD(P)-binding domain-containing protein n=1 Tax=Phakopsora pachyrhizi TaxID=170000 RepID=A0AAV0AII8_PHAPC|nr:hypothetical protein BY996DRAFT_4583129 [Phakopsora pachyrhizi]CAH7666659.1 hypothetical protein PPACK8108_LOCUS1008 [Phakopsora pachyrhizi]
MTASSPPKTVVIVGLSGAGLKALNLLAKELYSSSLKSPGLPESNVRVIGIEKSSYAFWPPGALRAAVVGGFEDQIISSLDHIVPSQIKKGKPDLVRVATGVEVTEVDFKSRSLFLAGSLDGIKEVVSLDGGKQKLSYDYLVIATGSSYAFPCRPPPDATDQESLKHKFQNLQKNIHDSDSILIVGGGVVGIELAGEVSYRYKDKKVHLVCSTPRLVPEYSACLSKSLTSQLLDRGVKIFFNRRADLTQLGIKETTNLVQKTNVELNSHDENDIEKVEVEVDFVFLATGNKPNTGFIPKECLNPKTNQLKVNSNLQVVIKDDSSEQEKPIEGVYGIGDVIESKDSKMYAALDNQAKDLTKNMLIDINKNQDQPDSTSKGSKRGVKKVDHKPFLNTIVIPLGPSGGGSQLFGFTFGLGGLATSILKGKTLFVQMFKSMYPDKDQ